MKSDVPLTAEIGRLRQRIRAELARPLAEINVLVSDMLHLPAC